MFVLLRRPASKGGTVQQKGHFKATKNVYQTAYRLPEGGNAQALPPTEERHKITHPALILVPEGQGRSGNGKVLLDKILQACGLEASACMVLEDPPGGQLAHWLRQLDFPLFIAFGMAPQQVGVQASRPKNLRMRLREVECVFGPDLARLADSPEAKKQLWTALQGAMADARPAGEARMPKAGV